MSHPHTSRDDVGRIDGERSLVRHESAVWVDFARCRGHLDLFFEAPGELPDERDARVAAAKALCAECPVQLICRSEARARRENGIWGGESEEERTLQGFMPLGSISRAVQRARRAWIEEQARREAS
jgi:WhiB family redox-sensing transcriptional regulator